MTIQAEADNICIILRVLVNKVIYCCLVRIHNTPAIFLHNRRLHVLGVLTFCIMGLYPAAYSVTFPQDSFVSKTTIYMKIGRAEPSSPGRWPNAVSMLGRHLRCRPSIETALGYRRVFGREESMPGLFHFSMLLS